MFAPFQRQPTPYLLGCAGSISELACHGQETLVLGLGQGAREKEFRMGPKVMFVRTFELVLSSLSGG